MCVHITSRAWRVPGLSPAQKLVLVRLADQASSSGFCWPSYVAVARDVGLSRRRVMEVIAALCEMGHVAAGYRFDPKTGKQTSNALCVLPPDDRRAADVLADAGQHVPGVSASAVATQEVRARRAALAAAARLRRRAAAECEISHPVECEGSHPVECEIPHPVECEIPHPYECEISHPNHKRTINLNLQGSGSVDPSSLTRFERSELLAGRSVLVAGSLIRPDAPEGAALALALRAQSC